VQGDDQRIQPVSIPGTVLVSPAPAAAPPD